MDCSPDHKTSLEAEKSFNWKSPEKQKSDWEVSELLQTSLDAVYKLQVSLLAFPFSSIPHLQCILKVCLLVLYNLPSMYIQQA